MRIGKLSATELKERVFKNIKKRRSEILNSPNIGDDCGIIDLGEQVCYISSDPITGAVNDIGKLAVNITCNDIATAGVEPLGIMITILCPPTSTLEDLEHIIIEMDKECEKLNIDILGGHTEVTDAVNKIIISTTGVGFGTKEHYKRKITIRENDIILLTKGTGIEGTAIIASEKEYELKNILSAKEIKDGKDMISMTSVVKEGLIASEMAKGMHDVTEGGVLGAIWEVSELAGLGVIIYEERLNVVPVTSKICDFYNIDPLKLISSGSMIIIVSPEKKTELINKLMLEGIPTFEIGYFLKEIKGKNIVGFDGIEKEINEPESDELYKVV